ncbi:fibronectin type III domain protein [Herbihabitans rhizosphaerae]|uniref:Fibronectin type III domain protein n=1 Tax=Herbihabitans rhizosphaerae TaxID=1872711 RepID=A0A4V2ETF1_9PSEU|nr:fibronectin type III domain-containing protein [Herbihabitans rhizosphaerae]RZS40853.1 fibronectin type III domain protein [Herbihabitans rhizosphaerae]
MRGFRIVELLTATAIAATGMLVLPTSSVASVGPVTAADPVRHTVNYRCVFPLIGEHVVPVEFEADPPDMVEVGAPSPQFDVKLTATASQTVAEGLRVIGAKAIKGGGTVATTLATNPGTPLPITVPVTIPQTDIPNSAPFDIVMTGKYPSFTLSAWQPHELAVGDIGLSLFVLTDSGWTFDPVGVPCRLEPGQNAVLAVINGVLVERPTQPGELRATATTPTSVSLAWRPSGWMFPIVAYDVFRGNEKVASVPGTQATVNGLAPGTEYTFTVQARDEYGYTSRMSEPVTVHTKSGIALTYRCAFPLIGEQVVPVVYDADPPRWVEPDEPDTPAFPIAAGMALPQRVVDAFVLAGTVSVSSKVSIGSLVKDVDGVRQTAAPATIPDTPVAPGMVLTASGTYPAQHIRTTPTTFTLENIQLETYLRKAGGWVDVLTHQCTLEPGQDNVLTTIGTIIVERPTTPGNPHATATSHDSVSLAWSPSGWWYPIVAYDVFRGAEKVASVPGTEATIAGLAPDTEYTFTVQARDGNGYKSKLSAPVTVRTRPAVAQHAYTLAGTSTLAAARTTVSLTGNAAATLDLAAGTHTAELTLRPTKVTLLLAGVLPAEADVQFATGPATGTLAGGVLSTASTVTITLTRVTVLGLPIAGGPTCRTAANVVLRSGAGFDPAAGGALTGTYAIPPFTGCGAATNMINGTVAGPGNTVAITLTPAAASR